jgi:hypothetical protein
MRSVMKSVVAVVVASSALAGCAVYGPPPVYQEAYVQPAPVYYQPAPVYVQPAPVYAAPPVTFGLNFGWWGGRGWHHR